jgi:aspartyl-tRNA synthetase
LETEGNEVRAIPAPTGGSRKFADRMNAFAQKEGLPGMGYIFWRKAEDGTTEAAGPIAKALGDEKTEAIRVGLGLGEGDAAFFLGGKPEIFEPVAGRARNEIGRELGLTEQNCFKFAWIVDFPMYEKTDEGAIDFSHNPFSMPQGGMEALNGDPLKVYAYQYDLACNGYELISGGIRNHKPEIMYKAFELAGYPNSEVDKRFGGMVKAFKYGAPPHGGCAAGIDRIVMLLADEANIREVIMFPMNQRAEDLLMGAPSEPANEQLRELRLRVLPKEG